MELKIKSDTKVLEGFNRNLEFINKSLNLLVECDRAVVINVEVVEDDTPIKIITAIIDDEQKVFKVSSNGIVVVQ